ncbi:MAG: DNA repair protein RadA [Lachnospiraceae bacterium]|nr:DNA repair protein RadA [Lachnospiraceae bacterium]
MPKGKKTIYFCQECGHEESKWLGQCPMCKEWNTFVEEKVTKASGITTTKAMKETVVLPLSEIEINDHNRTSTSMVEFDRVLGGGIVPGSLVLVGGDPGIGKSTLLLQMCHRLIQIPGQQTLYISGEESLAQIKLRANRIGDFNDDLLLLCETNLEIIKEVMERKKPRFVVIDSIQTMYSEDVSSAPGSVSQVRESTNIFMHLAKGLGITIFLVGHVTKEGVVAGPRVLEHMVDTVLYFEGDRHAAYRILRGVKNRFGPNEIGVFEMGQSGLAEVENPSEYMLSGKPQNASGSVVTCSLEGTRPLLLEIQALTSQTNFGMPRRTAAGTDYNRVNLLMAVLEKRIGIPLSGYDAYVNIAGGMRINEPAIDLAIVMALISSYKNAAIDERLLVFGEVGLSGEIRAVSRPEQRVIEAQKLGFETCIVPWVAVRAVKNIKDIKVIGAKTINDAVAAVF